MKRILVLALLAAVGLTGCQTARPIYYWGRYETLAYASYKKPDKATPEEQIRLLEEDLQQAANRNLAVMPGVHAHLGYLYHLKGDVARAREHLEIEKRLFPESTVFVDQLIQGLQRS